jgi:hypothetical protein
MGMDLEGAGGYFRWNLFCWGEVLTLAEEHGWMPVRTGPPVGVLQKDWDGDYFSNAGQRLYARDAVKLADALAAALKVHRSGKLAKSSTRPQEQRPTESSRTQSYKQVKQSHDNVVRRFITVAMPEVAADVRKDSWKSDVRTWLFSPEGQRELRKFIRFCRAGSFRIY